MAWEGSTRRERLPADWSAIRKRVLRRDGHRCTHTDNGIRCSARATDVDHIIAGDDHSEHNLRSLCSDHHRAKSAREGYDAMRRMVRARRAAADKKFRRTEEHPGLL